MVFAALAICAGTIHVPADHPTIQEAIDAAVAGDEVVVAPGEYAVATPISFKGKTIAVRGEGGAVSTTIRMAVPLDPTRASVVLFEDGETEEAILEGFTLTGGRGSIVRGAGEGRGGGGIACTRAASPTLRDLVLTGNSGPSGGGMLCWTDSSPRLSGVSITGNTATGDGGGLSMDERASPRLEDCTISKNVGMIGIYITGGSAPSFTRVRISENQDGGIYCHGPSSPVFTSCEISYNYRAYPGITCRNGCTPTLEGCTVSGNSAGGGAFQDCEPRVRNCRFVGNNGSSGGGLDIACGGIFEGCLIAGNASSDYGGGIRANWSNGCTFVNCVIAGNWSQIGGGISAWYAETTPRFIHCTIAGNAAEKGGAAFCENSGLPFVNCIIWGNAPNDPCGTLVSTLSERDPGFASSGSFDFDRYVMRDFGGRQFRLPDFIVEEPDYHLTAGSPAIGAASAVESPDTDFEGTPRPCGRRADLGAFEYCGARTLIVDRGGGGDHTAIQEAIDAATDGDLILVRPGTYEIAEPIAFAGKRLEVVGEAGPAATTIHMADRPSDPDRASVIIFDHGETAQCVLEGFTIANGRGTLRAGQPAGRMGGGIYCADGAAPTLASLRIEGNAVSGHGGGLFCDRCSLSLAAVEFSGNGAGGMGGAFYASESNVTMVDAEVLANSAAAGGGLCAAGGTLRLTACTVEGNRASGAGGGAYLYAAATSWWTRCTIAGNAATDGGGIALDAIQVLTIRGCVLDGNAAAASGGALRGSTSGSVVVASAEMTGNAAGLDGGGVAALAGNWLVSRCTLAGNSARRGGALYGAAPETTLENTEVWGNRTEDSGAVHAGRGTRLVNVTIAENYSARGQNGGIACFEENVPDLANTIVWGNAPGGPVCGTASHSLTIENPLFLRAGAYDFDRYASREIMGERHLLPNFIAAPPDLTLQPGSPAIDAGADLPAHAPLDRTGNCRPCGGSNDVGAYESCVRTTYVVDQEGVGDSSDIQAAIDACVDGDAVVVEPGEYVIRRTLTFRGKPITVRSAEGAAATVIRRADSPADYWSQQGVVLFGSGERDGARLEGFTLSGGKGFQDSMGSSGGGALIFQGEGSPVVADCTIVDNVTEFGGGGVYAGKASRPTLVNCLIARNSAAGAGGIQVNGASPTFRRCTIRENTALEEGGGIGVFGHDATPVFEDCIVAQNHAKVAGGGIVSSFSSSARYVRCVIAHNSSEQNGGGLYSFEPAGIDMANCLVVANSARQGGGGFYLEAAQSARVTFEACTVAGNMAQADGGGVYCYRDDTWVFSNCLLYGNRARRGGAAFCDSEGGPQFWNCTISRNRGNQSGGGIVCVARRPSLVNCIIWANENNSACGDMTSCLTEDPLFLAVGEFDFSRYATMRVGSADRAMPDFVIAAPDLRLTEGSPAIDAGSAAGAPPSDFAGAIRPCGAAWDVGAFEACKPPPPFIRGDVNGSGSLEVSDPVLILRHVFLKARLSCQSAADANDDGGIDVADTLFLLRYLFLSGTRPAEPSGGCGGDPTRDTLVCESYPPCAGTATGGE